MADTFTGNLNLRKPEVGHANDTWGGTAGLNGDLDIIDAIFLATGLGTAVGLHVGPAQVLNVEGGITLKDPVDTTKVAVLDRSLISTATTRTYQFPNASGVLALKTAMPTGTVLSGYYGTSPPSGFVFLVGRSIGDAASGATEIASPLAVDLFTLFWNLGSVPITGRGASAAADWAAHKAITLPDHRGRVMAGIDAFGSNVIGITARGTATGTASQTFAITGGSGTISGSATGSLSVIDTTSGEIQGAFNAQGAAPGFGVAVSPHTHNFSGGTSGSLTVGGTCNVTSGSTDTRSIVQPTIMVDVVIAL